jgi:hypothetical protein
MKHLESSKLINLATDTEAAVIKYSFVERLRGAFHVETVGDGVENFVVNAIGKDVPCKCIFNVLLKTENKRARLIVDGNVGISASTKILYTLGFLALLVLGLFPESTMLKTTYKGSAMDFMVFLFLGAFLVFDMNKKVAEPEEIIDRILNAVATEFGT